MDKKIKYAKFVKLCYKICYMLIGNKINKYKYDVIKQREIINRIIIKSNNFSKKKLVYIYKLLLLEKSNSKIISIDNIKNYKIKYWSIYIYNKNIHNLKVDVIVNCANDTGLGCFIPEHRCIDQQIHLKAGPLLRKECAIKLNNNKLRNGTILVTNSYNLSCKNIIHASIGTYTKVQPNSHLIVDCYLASLDYCKKKGYTSIAFSVLGADYKRYPPIETTIKCLANIKNWLLKNNYKIDIILCTHTLKYYRIYNDVILKIFTKKQSELLNIDNCTDSENILTYDAENILLESECDISSPVFQ